jgi:hypothetical protein
MCLCFANGEGGGRLLNLPTITIWVVMLAMITCVLCNYIRTRACTFKHLSRQILHKYTDCSPPILKFQLRLKFDKRILCLYSLSRNITILTIMLLLNYKLLLLYYNVFYFCVLADTQAHGDVASIEHSWRHIDAPVAYDVTNASIRSIRIQYGRESNPYLIKSSAPCLNTDHPPPAVFQPRGDNQGRRKFVTTTTENGSWIWVINFVEINYL